MGQTQVTGARPFRSWAFPEESLLRLPQNKKQEKLDCRLQSLFGTFAVFPTIWTRGTLGCFKGCFKILQVHDNIYWFTDYLAMLQGWVIYRRKISWWLLRAMSAWWAAVPALVPFRCQHVCTLPLQRLRHCPERLRQVWGDCFASPFHAISSVLCFSLFCPVFMAE